MTAVPSVWARAFALFTSGLLITPVSAPVGNAGTLTLIWLREIADSEGLTGWYAVIGLGALSEEPLIAYREGLEKDLRFARWNGSEWEASILDAEGDTGFFPSLINDTRRTTVSYARLDPAGPSLRIAEQEGILWSTEVVFAGPVGGPNSMTSNAEGRRRIAFDALSSGLLWAAETESNWTISPVSVDTGVVGISTVHFQGTYAVAYVTVDPSGQGIAKVAFGDGRSWVVETIANGTGSAISAAYDSHGLLHVSFGKDTRLLHLIREVDGWSEEVVDRGSNAGDIAFYLSLAIGGDDTPRVGYLVGSTYRLMYAVRESTGWVASEVDRQINRGFWVALAVDSTDHPHVVYQDLGYPDTTGDLWYATTKPRVPNRPPSADAGGSYTGMEGSPITFDAGGSSDPDGDPLTYAWDFTNDGTTDVSTTSPTVQHTYPDDFMGNARLTVSDTGGATSSALAAVTVANVPPSAALQSITGAPEGSDVAVHVRVTDPGTDTVDVFADWGDGTPSEHVATALSSGGTWEAEFSPAHPYGDDGSFPVVITVIDDDGGTAALSGILAPVDNAPPFALGIGWPTEVDEGATVVVGMFAQDPGSDDFTFALDFGNGATHTETVYNDGVGPDPDPSPWGTAPFFAQVTGLTRYTDDGVYLLRLTVTDDDDGVTSLDKPLEIRVRNVAPTIVPFGPESGAEGQGGAMIATATDPGSDPLTFAWTFELGPSFGEAFPATGSPTTATSTAAFLYGDDGTYHVALTVSDDDGGVATYETTVEVANVDPSVQITQVSRLGSFVLRVAGEKWHDVTAIFYQDGTELERVAAVRTPGSPDEQSARTATYDLATASRFTATILYTPADDPVNGQPNGANPVWVLVLADDGTEAARVHHTFNVEHPGTYVWDVDLTPYIAGLAVTFEAFASDPGSDDLTFTWDFGDGTPTVAMTYHNDGLGEDPPRSPGGTLPFAATDGAVHRFLRPGAYTITVTATDDDGGTASATVTITIPG